MDLSIVIPAYNEEARIEGTINTVCDFLIRRAWSWEVIVVDDGSTDTTPDTVEAVGHQREQVRLVRLPANRGKGAAIRAGAEAARGDIVGFLDADDKTDIRSVDDVFEALSSGADVVIGDRTLNATQIERARRRHREWGSRLFRWLLQQFLGLGDLPDTQCGFKFYRTSVLSALHTRACIDGYMFDVELLLLARQAGHRIDRIPVQWRDDPDSRFQPISGSWRNLRELFRIRRTHC